MTTEMSINDTDQWASRIINEMFDNSKNTASKSESSVTGVKNENEELHVSTSRYDYMNDSVMKSGKITEKSTIATDNRRSHDRLAENKYGSISTVTSKKDSNLDLKTATFGHILEPDVELLTENNLIQFTNMSPKATHGRLFNTKDLVGVRQPESDCSISPDIISSGSMPSITDRNNGDSPLSFKQTNDTSGKNEFLSEFTEVPYVALSENRDNEYLLNLLKPRDESSENYRRRNLKKARIKEFDDKEYYSFNTKCDKWKGFVDDRIFCGKESSVSTVRNSLGVYLLEEKKKEIQKVNSGFFSIDYDPPSEAAAEISQREDEVDFSCDFQNQISGYNFENETHSNSLYNLDEENLVKNEETRGIEEYGSIRTELSDNEYRGLDLSNFGEIYLSNRGSEEETIVQNHEIGEEKLITDCNSLVEDSGHGLEEMETTDSSSYKNNKKSMGIKSKNTYENFKASSYISEEENYELCDERSLYVMPDRSNFDEINKIKYLKSSVGKSNDSTVKEMTCWRVEHFKHEDIVDDDESAIITQRTCAVLSLYRKVCLTFETLFVKPLAILFSESLDFFLFVCFLFICVFYFLYEKVNSQISSFYNGKMCPSNFLERRSKMKIISHEHSNLPSTASEIKHNDKNQSTEKKIVNFTNISFELLEHTQKLKETDGFITVDPKDIAVIDTNFEWVTKGLDPLFDRGENYLEFLANFQVSHQPTIEVKTYKDLSVSNIALISAFDNIDFAMKKIPSSNEKHVEFHSFENVMKDNTGEFSCDLSKISNTGENFRRFETLTKVNSDSNLITFSADCVTDNGHILNSTEVDIFDLEPRRCCKFNVLSMSDIEMQEEDSNVLSSSISSLEKTVLNSSLSVNLPSFSSRSDVEILSDSLLKLCKSNKTCYSHCRKSREDDDKLKKIEAVTNSIGELQFNAKRAVSENSHNILLSNSRELWTENTQVEYEKPEIIENNLHIDVRSSGDSPVSASGDNELQNCNTFENSFSHFEAEFPTEFSNPSSSTNFNLDSNEKTEKVSEETGKSKKRKNSCKLKRRLSLLFNNWRNMHCVAVNPKNKMKYKKYTD